MPTILSSTKKLQKEGLLIITKSRAITTVKANNENKLFTRFKKIHNLESLYASGLVDFIISECEMPIAIICFGSFDVDVSPGVCFLLGAKGQR